MNKVFSLLLTSPMTHGILILLLFVPVPSYSQENQAVLPKGNWLISKTAPTTNISQELLQEHTQNLANMINSQLNDTIIPQALDRNHLGEILLLSQKAPPAEATNFWAIEAYRSEEEMLHDMEEKARERIYPTAFDVQKDMAYVLFLKSERNMDRFRLIKIDGVDALEKSLQLYWELGFIPLAMSFFQDQIWIMYGSFTDMDISSLGLLAKSTSIRDTGKLLDETLAQEGSQVIAYTSLNTDQAVVLFLVEK